MAQLKNDTEPLDIEELLNDLGHRLDRVKQLYEMYFLGIERTEPQVARKEIQRAMVALQQLNIRNTGLRFKFNALNQKWNTYQQYWGRTIREIENGTYVRHIQRLRRAAERDGKELPAEIVKLRERIANQFGGAKNDAKNDATKAADETQTPAVDVASASVAAPPPVARAAAAAVGAKPPAPPKSPPPTPKPAPPPPAPKPADAFSEFSDMRSFLNDDSDDLPAPPPQIARPVPPVSRTAPPPPKPIAPPAPPPKFKDVPTNIGLPPGPRPAATPPPPPRAPIPTPKPAPPPVAATPPAAAPRVIPGMNDGELRALHQRYVDSRKTTGEGANVSYDSLVNSIAKQVPRLLEQPGVRAVKFEVVTQNGKTILKAIPQK